MAGGMDCNTCKKNEKRIGIFKNTKFDLKYVTYLTQIATDAA